VMLQSFSRAHLDAVDQAHLGMSDTVAGSLRSRRWGDTPSMKRHGHPFPVAGDALKGACFLPILGWCRHDDSHFLRALGTKQCPGVSEDCLVRHILVHRHDEFLPVRKTSPRIRVGRWLRSVCIKLLTGLPRPADKSAVPACRKASAVIRMNDTKWKCPHPS
jgi:hypothetical protein